MESLIISAGAAMAAAITFLFKVIMSQSSEQSKLNGRVGKLEGEHKGISELSKKTLEVVHNAIAKDDKDDDE